MVIKAYLGDSLMSYRLNNIVVLLNYENATVDLSFELDGSLEESDPPNPLFSDHEAKITTRLKIPKIEIQPHPDWKFKTEGELFFKGTTYFMTGEGELKHHIGGEALACYLMMRLWPVADAELVIEKIGIVKELHLFQTVLSQNTVDGLEGRGY